MMLLLTAVILILTIYYLIIIGCLVGDVYYYKKDFLIDLIPFLALIRIGIQEYKRLEDDRDEWIFKGLLPYTW